jgi:transcriptional regulator with XRE-family HTH domain
MDQAIFLRLAKRQLGVTFARLADEMGVSSRTVEKWASPPESPDRREMPLIARKFLVRLLDDRKQSQLAGGDRKSAETIDAIAARIDPERLQVLLRAFDSLQRTARRLAPMEARATGTPRAFANLDQKNAWQREEEAKNARRLRAASARTR